MQSYFQILIFRGVGQYFSYSGASTLELGQHVKVPFGRSHVEGVIMSRMDNYDGAPLKAILSVNEKRATLPASTLALIEWFKTRYFTTPYKAYQTIVGARKLREVDPPEESAPPFEVPYPYTEEQQKAIDVITAKQGQSYYVHGVTGSGKTEVYMALASHNQNLGKKTIILVPEIALTPQYQRLFKERFGETVVVIHSNLTPKFRDIAWNRILNGHVDIVIGPRSAIFSPFSAIGTIIIDEEHESSYKQESHPRYETHAVARFLADYHQSTLVLGSATPRVDTYFRCTQSTDDCHLLTLKQRATGASLPAVQIIDMKQEHEDGHRGFISRALHGAITARLEKKEKVILLLNRRGYSPYIVCQKCKTIYSCPQCELSYTMHHDRTLRCHRCDTMAPLTHQCRKCHSNQLTFSGIGTQKAELECKKLFPTATISRLDRDTADHVTKVDAILEAFKSNGDILIGTQLIAKGHDIPTVTLVGVLNIDTSLQLPDFRSSERTFQLLTQVAGRAGRGKKAGEVFIQTLQDSHYAIQAASQHDFGTFYEQECRFRDQLLYPPYCKLISVILSGTEQVKVKNHAEKTGQILSDQLPTIRLMGPCPAPIEKIRHHYRWLIVIKYQKENEVAVLSALKDLPTPPKDIRQLFDCDPLSLL